MTTTIHDCRTPEVQTYEIDFRRLDKLGQKQATRLEALLTSGGVEALILRGVHMDYVARVYASVDAMRKATKKEPFIESALEQDHEKFSRYLSVVLTGTKEVHLVIDQFSGKFYAT